MYETRRDFLSTSVGIGSLGLPAAFGVAPARGGNATVTEHDLSSTPEPVFEVDGVSMTDETVEIETVETVENFEDEPIQMDGIEVAMQDDTIDEFTVEDCTIPAAVEDDALEIGQQILDGEAPSEPEVPSIVIDYLFPNLVRERIAAVPLDFFDPETSLGGLFMDILAVLDAFGGFRATLDLLTGLLDILQSPFGLLGGFLPPSFGVLNLIAGFFE